MDFYGIIRVLGGIGLFLFGMNLMGDGLKKAAGNRMEMILWRLSSTPLKGMLLGVFVTAVVQSSSATTVMAVSFVNAAMITLQQAVAIIMGANIGTTMTGWILTLSDISGSGIGQLFSTTSITAIVSVVGILMFMASKNKSVKNLGTVLLGLAVLLSGMHTISEAVAPLKESEAFVRVLTVFTNPVLGILVGIMVAAALQSVSASVGILQALSVTGVLSLGSCLPIILGMNIGASTPVLLTLIGSARGGKRAGLSYITYNIIGMFVCLLIYYPVRALGGMEFMNNEAHTLSIALLNTVTKVIMTSCLLPVHGLIEKLMYCFIPEDPSEKEDLADMEKLTDELLAFPPVAIEQCINAMGSMVRIAVANLNTSLGLFEKYNSADTVVVEDKENLVDKYEDKLSAYIMKLSSANLTPLQKSITTKMLTSISDFERIGDQAVNLKDSAMELEEKKLAFTPSAESELRILFDAIREITDMTTEAFRNNDYGLACRVEPLEQIIDEIHDTLKYRHVERLQSGDCSVTQGFVFNDILASCERISDHCSNIAVCTMEVTDKTLTQHGYSVHASETELYREAYSAYNEKYLVKIKQI